MMDHVDSEHLWHQLDGGDILGILNARTDGLSQEEVERRQRQHGPNALIEREGRGPGQILWEQIREPMIWLLVVAGAFPFLLTSISTPAPFSSS